tara:strand:+ start:3029 stop:3172 length:144 start_codon:yes stop_codon:yes gene_type:complete
LIVPTRRLTLDFPTFALGVAVVATCEGGGGGGGGSGGGGILGLRKHI